MIATHSMRLGKKDGKETFSSILGCYIVFLMKKAPLVH
jgi:hypothetical protein